MARNWRPTEFLYWSQIHTWQSGSPNPEPLQGLLTPAASQAALACGPAGSEHLLVEGDVWLFAFCPERQAALLQLGLGVVPVLIQNELLE